MEPAASPKVVAAADALSQGHSLSQYEMKIGEAGASLLPETEEPDGARNVDFPRRQYMGNNGRRGSFGRIRRGVRERSQAATEATSQDAGLCAGVYRIYAEHVSAYSRRCHVDLYRMSDP